ncbi:hypothetical protein THIOM_004969 [Candidatus Thiomargarita nelsonii]|uniref:Uncharacterized protein n=1 Tax=Candidatus Thiomargarita nelsonii TaxID=1003181 RepID=A0A176RUI1_9GAMM|nr:hypothetical protein THIOM_004969 [Candidatus Thiomargarita nelsonii]
MCHFVENMIAMALGREMIKRIFGHSSLITACDVPISRILNLSIGKVPSRLSGSRRKA